MSLTQRITASRSLHQTASLSTKWGSYGSGDGQFYYPSGITVDSSGNVYVADMGLIRKFTPGGQFVTKWGSFGSNAGEFSYPQGIAISPDEKFYVSDTGNNRIQVFGKSTSPEPEPEPETVILLQSPSNGTSFDCCSLSTPPIFGWTSEETFKGYEIQFSPDQSFGSIPVKMKAKVNESTNEVTLPAATWKKVLTMPGASGGTVYWRVQGKRANKTTGLSDVFSLEIEPGEAVGNPTLSPTSKSSLPGLSWENNCNMKFKVWFGSDESFTKKVSYSFSVKNPNEDGGVFSQGLTSAQWKAVRKLVNDVSGSTIYWYVESWDGLGAGTEATIESLFDEVMVGER